MENETKPAGAADSVAAPTFCTRTVTVMVRHSASCKDKKRGSDWRRCKCPKALLIYEGEGSGKNRRESAKTRSWERAEERAQDIRDSWDPTKQELKRLRAEKESKQVPIAEAVALYISDMATRLGDNGTCAMARSLFGNVDPETKAVTSNGHLFNWLDTLPAAKHPAYIADLSPAHLTAWRTSWRFGSDLTAANRWSMAKGFFSFCEAQGWIPDNPARKLKPPKTARGSRTTIFTDEQYAKILDAVPLYDPENAPAATRKAWQQRLTVFVELLRWSGMALVDATQYRPESVDAEGVLRYQRQKTGELATVPLPEHLIVLLRDVPLERDSVGAGQPFRTSVALASDVHRWQYRLNALFALAGIAEVRNGQGKMRRPHPHMLRDTFAVWHLRHGAPLHTVAKMLGHSKTATTEKAYLPWVKELDEAHIAAARKALAAGQPKPSKGRKVVNIAAAGKKN